jgi:branched-chain amino acid transport system substrate-binding protein
MTAVLWSEPKLIRKGGKMVRGKAFWVVSSAFLILLLAATISGAANRDFAKIDTIRFGILAPVQMTVGHGIINAAKLAAEEINAAGGIHGKKIEIIIGDTESKPEKGITAVKKLVLEDKVDVLVGEYNSGVALALQPFVANYKIAFMSTGCASPDLTNNVKKDYQKNKYYFFNMINSDRLEQGAHKFLKEFVNQKLGYKKFAILSENAKWTETFAPTLKKDLEKDGFDVPFYERFDVELKDFSPIFSKIKGLGVQWIAHIVSHGSSIPLVKAWQDNKPAPMGISNVGSMDSKFFEITGGACLYEITYNFIARAPLTDRTIPFWDSYVKKFGVTPVYTSGFTYDAVYMMAEVIKQKKSVKSDDIVTGLENISFKGVIHPQTGFDKQNHDVLEGRYVMPFIQWQTGGKQVVIYPDKFKTGEYQKPAWWK